MPETRLPISVAKPQALTQGNDRPETPCATDLRNRRTQAQLEGRNHITPTPYDILHDYISGPTYQRAKADAWTLCNQCPIRDTCLTVNREETWVEAMTDNPPRRLCDIDGCNMPHNARGLCSGHYKAARRAEDAA